MYCCRIVSELDISHINQATLIVLRLCSAYFHLGYHGRHTMECGVTSSLFLWATSNSLSPSCRRGSVCQQTWETSVLCVSDHCSLSPSSGQTGSGKTFTMIGGLLSSYASVHLLAQCVGGSNCAVGNHC